MISESDLAYAAGIVDGEGCIAIRRGKHGPHFCQVAVANTSLILCEWLKQRWGGNVHRKKRNAQHNWKPVYQWRVNNRLAISFLKQVRPYLLIKQAQADLALRLPSIRQFTKSRPARLTEETVEAREMLKQEMHVLNQRGIIH